VAITDIDVVTVGLPAGRVQKTSADRAVGRGTVLKEKWVDPLCRTVLRREGVVQLERGELIPTRRGTPKECEK
jgi:hypothetical protein